MGVESDKPEPDGQLPMAGNGHIDSSETPLPSQLQRRLPPEVVTIALQMLESQVGTDSTTTLDLTDEQKGQLIGLVGRKSDQEHSFKKWLLVSACFMFCFIILAIIGLIVFMIVQGETATLGPILSGLGGLIAGLASGIGGTYWYVSRRH